MNHFEWVDPKETLERHLREAGSMSSDPAMQLFGRLWQQIQDLPRHLGQHSGGMVICQGRLDESCRSRTPPCPAASSCSGTRTTAPTWGS